MKYSPVWFLFQQEAVTILKTLTPVDPIMQKCMDVLFYAEFNWLELEF